jgi:hypothetical protein
MEERKAVSTGTIFFIQKHKNIPFPQEKRYLWRSAWHSTVQGLRHTWTLQKNTVLNTVSFPPLNYSPSVLAVLLVVVLVVVLLLCCCRCLHLLCCRVANTAAVATVGTPPPLPLPSVGEEDDACYTNADSSLATLAQAVCRALQSHTSLDRPLPASCAGGKGSNDDGGIDSGGQSRIAYRIGMVLPSPTQGCATATRVAGK